MAKSKNPLFSFAATGTLAGALAFRQIAGRSVIQRTPRHIPTVSTLQQTERDQWRAAASAWRQLDTDATAEWSELATRRQKPVFAVFAGEYRIQQIAAPALPLVPAE